LRALLINIIEACDQIALDSTLTECSEKAMFDKIQDTILGEFKEAFNKSVSKLKEKLSERNFDVTKDLYKIVESHYFYKKNIEKLSAWKKQPNQFHYYDGAVRTQEHIQNLGKNLERLASEYGIEEKSTFSTSPLLNFVLLNTQYTVDFEKLNSCINLPLDVQKPQNNSKILNCLEEESSYKVDDSPTSFSKNDFKMVNIILKDKDEHEIVIPIRSFEIEEKVRIAENMGVMFCQSKLSNLLFGDECIKMAWAVLLSDKGVDTLVKSDKEAPIDLQAIPILARNDGDKSFANFLNKSNSFSGSYESLSSSNYWSSSKLNSKEIESRMFDMYFRNLVRLPLLQTQLKPIKTNSGDQLATEWEADSIANSEAANWLNLRLENYLYLTRIRPFLNTICGNDPQNEYCGKGLDLKAEHARFGTGIISSTKPDFFNRYKCKSGHFEKKKNMFDDNDWRNVAWRYVDELANTKYRCMEPKIGPFKWTDGSQEFSFN